MLDAWLDSEYASVTPNYNKVNSIDAATEKLLE